MCVGHDVFVVGGAVRDLLLNQVPKDVDLTTSASLVQVQQLAGRCQIVGKRNPLALVHASNGRIIDVTSLEDMGSHDVAALAKQTSQGRLQAEHLDQSWSLPWQHNMQSRDFTVNALMYDPFSHLLFDYVGGMQDCQKRRLRCIKEPAQSFAEDLARMLRAVRLSTRTGLHISKETMAAIRQLAHQLLRLNPSRLNLEANRMLSCGTCLKSTLLLWQLHLLDEVLPTHASYLRLHKTSRTQPLLDDNLMQRPLLLRVLYRLDAQASVDDPASMDVVVAVLVVPIIVEAIAAHKAELQAILHGASPHTFLQRPRKKFHNSDRSSTTTAQARATSAEVMDDALQRWQAKMGQLHDGSYSKRLQAMLACLTIAAMEVTRSKAAVGLLARNNVTVAQGMLIAFWHTVLHASK
ncbi:MAG: polynucleotide adenylyltransferase family, partial [Trebouxia sp. A1-2]